MQAAFVRHQWGFVKELNGQVGNLIVALYQQKLTYGEFGQRRYEVARDTAKAEREWHETALIADQQRQLQAQQLAQQEFQNNLNAWTAYTQTVSARQPQTIHLSTSCMSQPVGNFTMTNCH